MKTIGSVNLYSGIQNPEMNLSDNDAQLLIMKCNQLTQDTFQIPGKIGFSGYTVRFLDNGDGILALQVFDNVVTIYRKEGESPEYYVDTVGLYTAIGGMLSSLYSA